MVPPDLALDFAAEHDLALRDCLSEILGCEVPDTAWEVANLPFSIGGLGLAERTTIEHCGQLGKLGRLSPHSAVEAPQVERIVTAIWGPGSGTHLEYAVSVPSLRLGHSPDVRRPCLGRQSLLGDNHCL